MTCVVRWTRRALGRLDNIGRHISQDSPAAAARVGQAIVTAVMNLRQLPAAGRPGRLPGTRELVIPNTPYIVAYRVHDNDVEILTILHGAQRWPEDL